MKGFIQKGENTIVGLHEGPMSDLLATHISLLDACCAMMLWS